MDRGWVTAMFAADAELDVGPRFAAASTRGLDQFAHPFLIEASEWILSKQALADIAVYEASGVISADTERGLGQVIGAEADEVSNLGDIAGA